MDISDGMDKSWDHPWTTEEMRKRRRAWSLAGDAGLLRHLQQFSENLDSRANKTQETLDSLTTKLSETAILIDSMTNTSLALANTQFIESRVQEDDEEIDKKVDDSVQESKDQDLLTADLIASVSESVRQGLNIMDEKYRQMEVVDSDSEDEDDAIVLSVILGPNNPYQDRPLPYVIGSDKWMNSNKIGLESSSSESEQIDEEEEEASESDKEDAVDRVYDLSATPKLDITRMSSSLSESENYNQRNDVSYMNNEKIDGMSQNNINSVHDSMTPVDSVPEPQLPNNPTPNFAEELAKRLGTVRQAEKPAPMDEKNEGSINRYKDDLFTPEDDDNVFSDKSDNIFSASKGFFGDESSANLWKEKPIRPLKTNIIPASIDVPPPISNVSTKPKSAIDDLFADADSEDSDDIFSSKSTVKKVARDNDRNSNSYSENEQIKSRKYLDIVAPSVTGNMATSTPETNVNVNNLFSDEEDDSDLFRISKNQSHKSTDASTSDRKKPVGGDSILGNVSASDIENKASSRMPRAQSIGSSGSDTAVYHETGRNNEAPLDSSRNTIPSDNITERSSTVALRRYAENLAGTIGSSSSSGIGVSIQRPGINNTGGSSISADFQPQLTSTRLRSEEMYRERITSDSLFTAQSRSSVVVASNSGSTSNQPRVEQTEDTSSTRLDDVFDNEDLFGPPPLPKADTDSGDELFSTTSSGSRSQKSTDFLAITPQFSDKSRTNRKGLFDEDIDIFASKDSPDVDIFGITSKSVNTNQETNTSARKVSDASTNDLFANGNRDSTISRENVEKTENRRPATKKISLFDDEDEGDDTDLFGAKQVKPELKVTSDIFKEDDDDDLFSSKKVTSKKQANDKGSLPVEKPSKSVEPEMEQDIDNVSIKKTEKKESDIFSDNGLFSIAAKSHGLVFEDDDYDDLFGSKSTVTDERKDKQSTSVITEDSKAAEAQIKDETSIETHVPVADSAAAVSKPIIAEKPKLLVDDAKKLDVQTIGNKDSSNAEETESLPKKSPPKTLNIRMSTSSPPPEDSLAPRRAVSGKIKNLMGKMGDLKILSPMDTPPMWRRSEEKTDEEDNVMDRDSDDGGCISAQGRISPPSISEDNVQEKPSTKPSVQGGNNVETAISFDEPAQVETLSTAASKSRVRIQAKRRPQSRHARKSALRQSGIDFDIVDSSVNVPREHGRNNEQANFSNKSSPVHANANTVNLPTDSSTLTVHDNLHRIVDTNVFLAADDKSEIGSLSKESSMSANKNTLLSPSTDEEDIFDVPPDLPEDPQKEDTLFGRAPILSPVDKVITGKASGNFKPLRDTHIKETDNVNVNAEEEEDVNTPKTESDKDSDVKTIQSLSEKDNGKDVTESKEEEDNFNEESNAQVLDPLRDSSHDPLKDPSQLFAFVTKTPSPEKGKNVLFSEDASLFSNGSKISRADGSSQKQVIDLFADDVDGDLFSAALTKPVKKPLKDTKISLFDDEPQDDEDESLFGFATKKPAAKVEVQNQNPPPKPQKKVSLFDDDENDIDLFTEQSEQSQKSSVSGASEQVSRNELFSGLEEPAKTSSATDIFGDQSSGEDDIFATKTVPKKLTTSKSLFPSDDEDSDNQFLGKLSSTNEPKTKPMDNRSSIKKAVTRDLKKTAEKIGEDPLSILKDD